MILFTQKDFDVVDRCLREGVSKEIRRRDGQGLRAAVIVEPAGKVWGEYNHVTMSASLHIEGGRHGDCWVHCRTVGELVQACREYGV